MGCPSSLGAHPSSVSETRHGNGESTGTPSRCRGRGKRSRNGRGEQRGEKTLKRSLVHIDSVAGPLGRTLPPRVCTRTACLRCQPVLWWLTDRYDSRTVVTVTSATSRVDNSARPSPSLPPPSPVFWDWYPRVLRPSTSRCQTVLCVYPSDVPRRVM